MITGAIRQAEVRVREMRRFLSLSEKKTHAIKNIIERTEVNFENPIADWAQEASSFTAARTYDYACSVVLLYGLIERFIEDLAEEYLDILLNRLGKFNRLPEKLRQTHFDVTIAQLLRTRDSRYNGKCDAASLASSLASGLSCRGKWWVPTGLRIQAACCDRLHTNLLRTKAILGQFL